MLKKTIQFQDWNGVTLEEDFYFHLSKNELVEMVAAENGDLVSRIKDIVSRGDGSEILSTFRMIILKSYGIRSADGRRFQKSDLISEEFTQTDAFDRLYMELCTDANASAEFIRGILPVDIEDMPSIENVVDIHSAIGVSHEVDVDMGTPEKRWDDYTREELLNMSTEKFNSLVGTDPTRMDQTQLVLAMQRRILDKKTDLFAD